MNDDNRISIPTLRSQTVNGEMMATVLRNFLVLITVALSSAPPLAIAESSQAQGYRENPLPSDSRHKLCIPVGFDPTGGKIDVLVHFHGSPKSVAASCRSAGLNCVVVGASYSGLSSVYRKPFSANRQLFQEILDEALLQLRSKPEIADSTEWGTVAVSSFSAGFAAIREILKSDRYFERIDAVFLVDSLYSGYVGDGTSEVEQGVVHPGLMKEFLRYAHSSAVGEKVMIVTHCCGPTPGYASTRETADYLLKNLNLQADLMDRAVKLPEIKPPNGGKFRIYRQANRAGFWLFGTPGNNVEDHVQHFRHMGYWLRLLPFEKQIPPSDTHLAPN